MTCRKARIRRVEGNDPAREQLLGERGDLMMALAFLSVGFHPGIRTVSMLVLGHDALRSMPVKVQLQEPGRCCGVERAGACCGASAIRQPTWERAVGVAAPTPSTGSAQNAGGLSGVPTERSPRGGV